MNIRMDWTKNAFQNVEVLYEKMIGARFVEELTNGTLEEQKFKFYIEQDTIFLIDCSEVLLLISKILKEQHHIQAFQHFSTVCAQIGDSFFKNFIGDVNDSKLLEASPTCLLYTSFLYRLTIESPVEVAAVSILPCIYFLDKVGKYILDNHVKQNNPYTAWIANYGNSALYQLLQNLITICSELAEKADGKTQSVMMDCFIKSSQLELMFLYSAYNMEQWPLKSD